MFKNLKLAFKIGGGFVMVLLLTVIIATLCVFSLKTLEKTSYKNDMTSMIVQNMQAATVAGKNFVITRADSYRKEVEDYTAQSVQDGTKLRKIEKNKEHVELFTLIVEGAQAYQDNFKEYGRIEDVKAGTNAEMTLNSELLEANVQKLLAAQESRFSSMISSGSSSANLADRLSKLNAVNTVMRLYDEAHINIALYLSSKDQKDIEALQKAMTDAKDILVALRARLTESEHQALVDAVLASNDKYNTLANEYVKMNADQEAIRVKLAEGGAKTIANANKVSSAAAAEMAQLMAGTVVATLISSILAVLLGVFMAVLITRTITSAMRKGVDFAVLIAQGDLTAQLDIQQEDEIGLLAKSLQDMLGKLTQIVEEVNSAARQVSSGSQQLSSTSQQMSQGATEQASSVEEISSSMEEMTSNIKQNADNALQTEKIAQKSAQAAEEGAGGQCDGQCDEGNRFQDRHHRRNCPFHQHACPERLHRGGPGGRIR